MANEDSMDMNALDKAISVARQEVENTTLQVQSHGHWWWSTESAMTMCTAILVFGLIMAIMASYLIRKNVRDTAVLRVFGVILILILTVFLVVAGYNDRQMAPALGLLGTIAGYLLGKVDASEKTNYDRGPKESKEPTAGGPLPPTDPK